MSARKRTKRPQNETPSSPRSRIVHRRDGTPFVAPRPIATWPESDLQHIASELADESKLTQRADLRAVAQAIAELSRFVDGEHACSLEDLPREIRSLAKVIERRARAVAAIELGRIEQADDAPVRPADEATVERLLKPRRSRP